MNGVLWCSVCGDGRCECPKGTVLLSVKVSQETADRIQAIWGTENALTVIGETHRTTEEGA